MLLKKRQGLKAISFLLTLLMLFSIAFVASANEPENEILEQNQNEEELEVEEVSETKEEPEQHDEENELEAQKRAEAIERFNSAVNPLKTKFPKFYFVSEQGMLVPKKQGGLLGLIGEVGGIIGGIIGGLTGETPKEFETILGSILLGGSQKTEYVNVSKGENNIDIIPLKGKPYVSALTADDEFEYEYKPYSFGGFDLKINFPDEMNPGQDSVLHKVFDLPPIEELYGLFYNITPELDWSKVQLKITNAGIDCRVNQKDELSFYRTYYEATIAISNISDIELFSLEFPDSMFLAETSINNIDWTPRKLGDGDGDGYIRASDARTCLRIAARLESVSPHDFPYYDVNKDLAITAVDARMILRASAGLLSLDDVA